MKIILVGAGPRGLVAAERIIEQQRVTKRFDHLKIVMIDPYGVGGRVWPVDQPHELIMNTTPDYITLFTAAPNKVHGPLVSGTNLYEWAKSGAYDFIREHDYQNQDKLLTEVEMLQYNGYASRSLYGAYQQWFYEYLQTRLDQTMELRVLKETVKMVIPQNNGYVVKTGSLLLPANAVIMALGHNENELTDEQQKLNDFAENQRLHYVTPTQPQEYDFSNLQPKQSVILRGLGLSFFDAVTMLTRGRGGNYHRDSADNLVYEASGREPLIIAGSRRGYPLHGKGLSDRPSSTHAVPHFLTTDWIKSHLDQDMSGQEFIDRVHYEVEYAYYERLIKKNYPQINASKLLNEFIKSNNPDEVIQQSEIDVRDYFNWQELVDPQSKPQFDSVEEYLEHDVETAKQGLTNGPYAGAMAMYHDLYDQIRLVVDGQKLTDDDYLKFLLGQLNHEHSFLSVGPPMIRIEELRALLDAGIVKLLGSGMKVDINEETGKFQTWSQQNPGQKYESSYLVEARLPQVNAQTTKNPLIKQLLSNRIAYQHQLQLSGDKRQKTGAVYVDVQTERISQEHINRHLYFWGVPTEGRHWLMTASPHPGINDVVLRTADLIVTEIFRDNATSTG